MSREGKRLSGKQWNRKQASDQERKTKMKRTAPRKRNRLIEEYLWTDNDDGQDVHADVDWDDFDFVDDDDFYYFDLEPDAEL